LLRSQEGLTHLDAYYSSQYASGPETP